MLEALRREAVGAIDFDGKPRFVAVEVEYVGAELVLATKLGAGDVSRLEGVPENGLGVCGCATELAAAFQEANED